MIVELRKDPYFARHGIDILPAKNRVDLGIQVVSFLLNERKFTLDPSCIKDIEEFNNKDIGYDIGNKTLRNFYKDLSGAKRVIINGPMGMFEDTRFTNGTNKLLKYLDKNKIKTLVGGGDTASSVNKLGYQDSFYHVSTGGGATLKYMEDGLLVGIEAIDDVNEE